MLKRCEKENNTGCRDEKIKKIAQNNKFTKIQKRFGVISCFGVLVANENDAQQQKN